MRQLQKKLEQNEDADLEKQPALEESDLKPVEGEMPKNPTDIEAAHGEVFRNCTESALILLSSLSRGLLPQMWSPTEA